MDHFLAFLMIFGNNNFCAELENPANLWSMRLRILWFWGKSHLNQKLNCYYIGANNPIRARYIVQLTNYLPKPLYQLFLKSIFAYIQIFQKYSTNGFSFKGARPQDNLNDIKLVSYIVQYVQHWSNRHVGCMLMISVADRLIYSQCRHWREFTYVR